MNYLIVILVTLAACRAAGAERHAAWPLVLLALLIGVPMIVRDDGPGYLISCSGWLLLAMIYVVWRVRNNRALGVQRP